MIEFQNVSKSFEKVKAIDHISAVIEDGHVFGLIGTGPTRGGSWWTGNRLTTPRR